MSKNLRCALYDRVSTELQVKEGLSLDAQRKALTDYAMAHGHMIAGYYSDEGLSARKKMQHRKELMRLLNDVKADKIDLILVTKLDRWFRNIKDYHNTQAVLEAHSCNWKTIFEEYDTSTANGRFAINIMLSVNENECDRDSDRIREVFNYKRQRGEVLSGAHASFGYRTENKKFVKDKNTKKIVDDFFDFYLTFYSKRRTVNYILEKYGSASPSESTLMYMFKNPVYYGYAYGKENFCEGYITQAQFELIRTKASLKEYNGQNTTYLFSRLIRCPVCGKNFSGYRHRTKKASGKLYISPAYHCKQRQRSKLLCSGGIDIYESTVENYMLANIKQKIPTLSLLQIQITLQLAEGFEKNLLCEQAKNKRELERLNHLFQKGRITEEYYENQYLVLSDKISDCDHADKLQSHTIPIPAVNAISGNWLDVYSLLDREHRQAFWQGLIESIGLNIETHKICTFYFLQR